MDYRKKLKTRLYIRIGIMVIGIAVIVLSNIINRDSSDFMQSYGFALFVCGAASAAKFRRMMNNDRLAEARRTAENDERNISIMLKAKNVAFSVYAIAGSVLMVVFRLMGRKETANVIVFGICALLIIYIVAYMIISKRS